VVYNSLTQLDAYSQLWMVLIDDSLNLSLGLGLGQLVNYVSVRLRLLVGVVVTDDLSSSSSQSTNSKTCVSDMMV
jgi:hypothetical protein